MDNLRKSLTGIETRIMEYYCKGMTTKEIAKKLNRSISTVQTHCKRIYLKLNVYNRAEAVCVFINNQLKKTA